MALPRGDRDGSRSSASLGTVLAAPGAARRGQHRQTSSPPATRSTPRSTPAGRPGPAATNRRKRRRSARSRPRTSSSKPPPPTRTGASPSSSSGTNRRTSRCRSPKPGRRTEKRPRRPPGRPQRQPGATDAVPARDLRSRRRRCPPESKVGESNVTAALPAIPAPPTAAAPRPTSTTSSRSTARRHGSGSNWSATKSSSQATSTGPATTTRASRSTCRRPCRTRGARRPDPRKPAGLRRPRRRRHLHHHARAPASAKRFPARPGTSTRPSCCAASYQEEANPGYSFPQSAQPPLESPIPPAPRRNSATRSPTTRTSTSTPDRRHRLARRRQRSTIDVPHISGPTNRTARTPAARRSRCRSGWASTPRPPDGLQACRRRAVRQGDPQPGRLPGRLEDRHGDDRLAAAAARSDLEGDVYVGQQLSRDPASGNEYRIFVNAVSARYGVDVRLVGNVRANPVTGQLTTTITENPQVPFTSFVLDFDDGPRAVLSSPPTCGPNRRPRVMTPWSGNPAATPRTPIVAEQRPGRRPLRENDGRAPLRAGLRGRARRQQGRRLQPAQPARSPAATASRS